MVCACDLFHIFDVCGSDYEKSFILINLYMLALCYRLQSYCKIGIRSKSILIGDYNEENYRNHLTS